QDEDIKKVIKILGIKQSDSNIVKKLQISVNRAGPFTAFSQIEKIFKGNEDKLENISDILKQPIETIFNTLDYVSTVNISSFSNILPVGILPQLKNLTFPKEKPPPDKKIPEHPTWMLGKVNMDKTKTRTRSNGCKYSRRYLSEIIYGPIQSEVEKFYDIVVVEPTGGSVEVSSGVSIASAGSSVASYYVVQITIGVLHRWRLERYQRTITRTTRCPPDWSPQVKTEVNQGTPYWAQLDPIYPYPAERKIIKTIGWSAKPDPYSRAKQIANDWATSNGIGRGAGSFQDSPN
ncbi:hypothetical protein ACFL96_20430, partial [Thermoproteota archaeon]